MTQPEALTLINKKIKDQDERINTLIQDSKDRLLKVDNTYFIKELEEVLKDYKSIQEQKEKYIIQRYAIEAITD